MNITLLKLDGSFDHTSLLHNSVNKHVCKGEAEVAWGHLDLAAVAQIS